MARTLLILGAGRGQLAAYRAARRLGLTIVGLDPNPLAPGLAVSDHAHVLDLGDIDAVLALARRHRVDGVFTMAADFPMPTLGAVCVALDLPGPGPDVVARATNKRLMRQAFAAAGVPCPMFEHVSSLAEAVCAVAMLAGDAIAKPAMSHGGRGVSKIPAGSSHEAVRVAYVRALGQTRADGVMIEEFVDGPEFSVESITWQGRTSVVAVTEKITSGAPYFVELSHIQPPTISAPELATLSRVAIEAVAALGIDSAAGHTEIRLAARGPVLMETGARLGGGFITSHLVPLSTGVDLVGAAVSIAVGLEPDLHGHGQKRPAAIRFVCALPGVVQDIRGVDAARAAPGVQAVELYVDRGARVPPLTDSTGRCGHVICTGDDAAQAFERAESVARGVEVLTVDHDHR